MLVKFALLVWTALAHAATSPETILKNADEIRNPDDSFMMKVEVKSTHSGDTDTHLFEVSLKGNDKTVVRTLAPKRDAGRDLLMIDENMWAYVPNLKRAVRVGLSQKLTGEAANGDISRMRWAQDYSGTIEKENGASWTLLLTAKKKGLTYEKIRAVIEKKTFKPLTAEYLTAEGKILKRAAFKDYKAIAGKSRPSLLVISDAVRADQKSEVRILEMKVKSFPDTLFSLERFQSR
jgi:outer membrane lipoprotein-sorting protein